MLHIFNYCLFRTLGFFISLLPISAIHSFGNFAGAATFLIYRKFRKKALGNLAIAYGSSKSEQEREKIARASFQNVMITCLEFFHFKKQRHRLSDHIVFFENNPDVLTLLENRRGVIFLTAHQANWEIPFLAATERFPGVAIGRPIKNKWIYRWILSVREMHGGKIVIPKRAIKEGLKALKEGKFLGIVGDQAFPESPYSFPLFGTRAWTTTAPALLAYKAGCPIVVGITRRIGTKFSFITSPPFWPDLTLPLKEAVPKLMDHSMAYLEKSIKEVPEEWMWIHDRWKQQGVDLIKRHYRFAFILITFPKEVENYLSLIPLLQSLYPRSFLTFLLPKDTCISLNDNCSVLFYEKEADLFLNDWRYQLILDFYDSPKLRSHFQKLGAFKTLGPKQMIPGSTLEEMIKKTLIKKECLITVSI